ncbi:MAG: T9SS type A sorting domain-containing protein [Saprospiraceae bacterium]|nr:T9SS type A sorting domain-containing protein [Saprospiraceae bacterium]
MKNFYKNFSASIALCLTFFSVSAQCPGGETQFTWEGSGRGNEMVWTTGQNAGSDIITDCTPNIEVKIAVEDPNDIYYNGTQDGGNSTTGFFGPNGLTVWLDNNENLYDTDAMDAGEEITLVFGFSEPVILLDFVTSDIDWRNISTSARWQDVVEVRAQDELGAQVPLNGTLVDPNSTIKIVDQVATADYDVTPNADGGLDASDPASQVAWNSNNELISSLRVTYRVGVNDSGQQAVLLGDMTIISSTALPVELTDFSAEQKGSDVVLNWTTASEQDNDYFDVEYSIDGLNWTNLAQVDGQGSTSSTTQYNYTHNQVVEAGYSVLYYRLRQVDFDGTTAYSSIQVVVIEVDTSEALIFPNPARQGRDVTIVYPNIELVEVYSISGQRVYIKAFNRVEGVILPTTELSKGAYVVVVNGQQSLKLIVQ